MSNKRLRPDCSRKRLLKRLALSIIVLVIGGILVFEWQRLRETESPKASEVIADPQRPPASIELGVGSGGTFQGETGVRDVIIDGFVVKDVPTAIRADNAEGLTIKNMEHSMSTSPKSSEAKPEEGDRRSER